LLLLILNIIIELSQLFKLLNPEFSRKRKFNFNIKINLIKIWNHLFIK